MMNFETLQVATRRLAAEPLTKGFKPEGLYTYTDENGHPLFSKIRLKHPQTGEKWIRPIHLSENGYVFGEPKLKGKKPLYFLLTLKENTRETVWITEGEKCAESLASLGLIVTTSGSSDSVETSDWNSLMKRKVIIWPDNDPAGLRYAQEVTCILKKLGCFVQWVDIQKLGLSHKGDVVDWLALHPEATKQDIEALPLAGPQPIESQESSEDIAWEDPILFNEIETPEIPADLLPEILGKFAKSLAVATETQEALSVMSILGALSAALSKRFCVSPKPGWEEPINIYTLIALPPANNKTFVFNQCTEPLTQWEREQAILLGPQIQKQLSERKTLEKIIEGLRSKASREKNPVLQKNLIQEIQEKDAELIEPQALPQLFANDCTPESLAVHLHEQKGRFAVFSDEGGIMEVLSGLYSNGKANVDVILKGIDGGHVRVRRKDRSFDLNPFLSIVMAVQPAIIQRMGAKKAFTGNGMMERFLYVIPKSRLGYRTHDKPSVPLELKRAYQETIKALLAIPSLLIDGQERARLLTLSPEAFQEWRAFQDNIEVQLRPQGRLHICQGWGGKICGFALRIAGLLHVAKYRQEAPEISLEVMNNALEIAALLIDHALAAYESMGADPINEETKIVFQWIKAQNKSSFTRSEIILGMKNRQLGKSERLTFILQNLIDRKILNKSVGTETRKPTTVYQVNPRIFEGEY